jgi:hypothetical protein
MATYSTYIYIHHINYHYPFSSSYFFYTFGQAGWPRSLMSGTIVYPLPTDPEGKQYIGQKITGVLETLTNICYLQKMPIPSKEFVRELIVSPDTPRTVWTSKTSKIPS